MAENGSLTPGQSSSFVLRDFETPGPGKLRLQPNVWRRSHVESAVSPDNSLFAPRGRNSPPMVDRLNANQRATLPDADAGRIP